MDVVIKHFYGDLVSKLPMDDAKFRALLVSADLFPGDLKQAVQAKPTSADKAEYFIDHGINNDAEDFVKLVDVMTNSGNNSLIKLAAEIRRDSRYSRITAAPNGHRSTGAAANMASTAFDCASAKAQLTELYTDITNLPINKILGELLRSKVILDKEKEVIETISVESKRMEYLLDKIILPSLIVKVPVKYKRFLEVMERNEDVMFTSMAQRLGGSKRVPEKC